MTAPADYSNLYSRTRRPRSPQGDGAYDANGMAPPTGQQHAYGQNDGGAYNSQTSHPRPFQQQGQGFQANTQPGPGNQGGAQTFSQMQAQGQARPLPPMQQAGPSSQTPTYQPSQQQNQLGNQLQQAVSQTLAAPTRYDMPQVQQVRDALTNQLQTQYAGQQKQINDQLASRGLLSSSIAGGYYGDLATNQANALADMNAKLIQDAAATNAADRSSALASGQNFSNSQSAQGIAGYNANLAGQNQAQQFGIQQGGLTGMYNGQQTLAGQAQAQQNAIQAAGLTGVYNGQQTLGAQQLSQSGQQFAQNLALQQQLGLGNLGVAQQQASTGAAAQQAQAQQAQQQMNIQNQQFGQTYVLQQAAQNLNAQVQTGQLSLAQAQQQLAQLTNSQQYGLAQGSQGIAQQQANTQQQQVAGQLGLGQAQLAQAGQQFQQQYGLSQQQANTATAAQQAQAQYQQGQLGVAEKQVALQDAQFQQNFTQNASQFGQTYALQKAASDLQNKVQLGQLDNQTAQQALAELSQRTQASQFTLGLNQNQTQFTQNLTAQQQQNAAQNAMQAGALTGQYAGVTGYSANGQPIYGTPSATLASQQQIAQNAAMFGQGAKYDAATGSYVDASGKPLTTLQAQQLAQQGQQNTMNNNLSFMQLLNNPTGALASSTNSTFAPDFITQLYKSLGIDTSAKTKTSTSNVTGNTTGGTTGATGGATAGGSNTGTGDGGTGSTTGGDEIFNTRRNSTGGDANPDTSAQPDLSQMGLTPAQLAQLQRMLGLSNG